MGKGMEGGDCGEREGGDCGERDVGWGLWEKGCRVGKGM